MIYKDTGTEAAAAGFASAVALACGCLAARATRTVVSESSRWLIRTRLPLFGSDAATSGVKATIIIDGRVPHALLLELFTNAGVGSMILDA